MIKCDFDEVLKYAKDYFGINEEEVEGGRKVIKKRKEIEAREEEDSIRMKDQDVKMYKKVEGALEQFYPKEQREEAELDRSRNSSSESSLSLIHI